MHLRWRWLAVGGAVLAALLIACVVANPYLLLVFFSKPLKPSTPPLLINARNEGGQLICPPHDSAEAMMAQAPAGGSPVVEARLANQFPPGSDEARLVATLRDQGFGDATVCDNDPTIHIATFVQSGGGFWGPYPIVASVAWKTDKGGKLKWTKANVGFIGP